MTTAREAELYKRITAWEDSKAAAAAAKLAEINARDELVKFAFPEVAEGVQKIELPDARVLKVTGKKKFDLADDDKVEAALLKMAAAAEDGAFYAKRVVKRKLELATGEFKKLPPALKKIFDKVVTIKPATPEVEVVRPKEPAVPA